MEIVFIMVYYDERVPHVEVVNSTAQALQLTFHYRDQEIACLFRSPPNMGGLHPPLRHPGGNPSECHFVLVSNNPNGEDWERLVEMQGDFP